MRVTHTYSADGNKSSRAVCLECNEVHTILAVIIEDMGAKKLHTHIRKGKRIVIEQPPYDPT